MRLLNILTLRLWQYLRTKCAVLSLHQSFLSLLFLHYHLLLSLLETAFEIQLFEPIVALRRVAIIHRLLQLMLLIISCTLSQSACLTRHFWFKCEYCHALDCFIKELLFLSFRYRWSLVITRAWSPRMQSANRFSWWSQYTWLLRVPKWSFGIVCSTSDRVTDRTYGSFIGR